MKRIILTGGGTAGHVTPNIAMIPTLQAKGFDIHYIGSYDGIEKKLIEELDIPYHGISSGKLRRYFDVKNFSDPAKVIKGYSEAKKLLKELKPDIIFSKGGFVTVPVVLAAKSRKIPVIIHESDMTPGLANKICIPSAKKVCCNFPEAMHNLPAGKGVLTGTPIRKELFEGDPAEGLEFCGFTKDKPVLLIVGGSTGSIIINDTIRDCLDDLLISYQIIHICGKDKLDPTLTNTPGYVQFEYVKKELSSILAAADMVISRAGANAICELLDLRKPNILIPLSAAASRGDQILNAASFKKQGFSYVIPEEQLSKTSLLEALHYVQDHTDTFIQKMANSQTTNSIDIIVGLLEEEIKN